jgi:hypothetical protein
MIGNHPAIRRPLAKAVGLSRASLYYRSKQPDKDWALKQEIEAVLREHPAYGHKRIALALKRNKKAVLRVMHKFGLKPYRRRGKKWRKPKEKSGIYPNLLLTTMPVYPHHVWVADFTHLLDLGDPNRFKTLGELVAEIYRTVHAYNTTRIHLALKMPPLEFAKLQGAGIMKTAFDWLS